MGIFLSLMLSVSPELGDAWEITGWEEAGQHCPRSPWSHISLCLLQEAWKHAIEKAKHMPDPWAEFHLEDIATECATRHRSAACLGVLHGPRFKDSLGVWVLLLLIISEA